MRTPFVALSVFLLASVALAAMSAPGIYSPFDGGSGAPGTINGSPSTVAGAAVNGLSFNRNDADFVDYGNSGDIGTGSLKCRCGSRQTRPATVLFPAPAP